MTADLSTSNSELLDLKNRSIAFNILKREWENYKNLYQGLLEKVKRASLAANLEMDQLSLSEPAPSGKSFPNIPKNVVVAMSCGGLVGLALVFIMALHDRKFRSIKEVEDHAQLPVLSVIPLLTEGAKRDEVGCKRILSLMALKQKRLGRCELV